MPHRKHSSAGKTRESRHQPPGSSGTTPVNPPAVHSKPKHQPVTSAMRNAGKTHESKRHD